MNPAPHRYQHAEEHMASFALADKVIFLISQVIDMKALGDASQQISMASYPYPKKAHS